MSITEYNQEAHMALLRKQSLEEGVQLINELNRKLLADGRSDELLRATTDSELQVRLMREYGLADDY